MGFSASGVGASVSGMDVFGLVHWGGLGFLGFGIWSFGSRVDLARSFMWELKIEWLLIGFIWGLGGLGSPFEKLGLGLLGPLRVFLVAIV